jgi:vacuolar-type H+-ATPase subunit F/Vma7
MMQKATETDPNDDLRGIISGQRLVTLLALVGARQMDPEALREKTKLAPSAFRNFLRWLQREYLVDVISSLDGEKISEKIELTDKGEELLVRILEKTCELPELR